jgi:hypothetical protein
MKALPKRDTNNLSPLVVSNPKIPLLGEPPGTFFSQRYITVIQTAMNIKKLAVGQVQAIHVMKSKSKRPFSFG